MTRRTRIIGILSTEHTEDTEFFIHGGQDFLVATLEILEEIFNKNMAYGQK